MDIDELVAEKGGEVDGLEIIDVLAGVDRRSALVTALPCSSLAAR